MKYDQDKTRQEVIILKSPIWLAWEIKTADVSRGRHCNFSFS